LRSLERQETCWKSLERRRKHGGDHFSNVVNMLEITGETETCCSLLERRRKHAGGNSREVGIVWRVTLTHIVKRCAARVWTGDASCGPVGGSCDMMFDYSRNVLCMA